MKKWVVPLVLGIVLVAVGLYIRTFSTDEVAVYPAETKIETLVPTNRQTQEVNSAISNNEIGSRNAKDDAAIMTNSGVYEEYNETLLNQRLAEGKRVVLFFHAAWCPTCRSADKNIRSATAEIPSDIAIVKVNYDRENVLKRKYGVLYQHTFVQIAGDKSMITKFQGSRTVPAIITNIQ